MYLKYIKYKIHLYLSPTLADWRFYNFFHQCVQLLPTHLFLIVEPVRNLTSLTEYSSQENSSPENSSRIFRRLENCPLKIGRMEN